MKLTLAQKIARREKVNATALTRIGLKIRYVEHLAQHAADKRSVYCRNCWGLLPALVVMNIAASQVLRAIQAGEIFEYDPPKKAK